MAPERETDDGHDGSGEGRLPPQVPSRAQTREVAPGSVGAQRRVSGASAVERILQEGEDARLALAQRTAREVLTDVSTLDAKRLARLGSDGLVRFIAELRQHALGPIAPPPLPSPSSETGALSSRTPVQGTAPPPPAVPKPTPSQTVIRRSSSEPARTGQVETKGRGRPAPPPAARGPTSTRSIIAPVPRPAAFAGWWQAQVEGRPGFETRAFYWGLSAGAVLLAACLVLFATTHR